VVENVGAQKDRQEQHQGPVQEAVGPAEARPAVEHQEQQSAHEMKEEQGPLTRKVEKADQTAQVGDRVEQADGVEQPLLEGAAARVAEQKGSRSTPKGGAGPFR